MKKMLLVLLSLCLLTGMAPALAEEPAGDESISQWFENAVSSAQEWAKTTGEIEVRGEAVRTVMPDTVTILIGVSIEREDEKIAQAEANKAMNDVIAALKEIGLDDDAMTTAGFSLDRQIDYSGRTPRTTGYAARLTTRVKLTDFDLIGTVLDTAVENGANSIDGLTFGYSGEGEVYRQALRDAIEAARAKAETMADAAGVELKTLLSLRESGYGSPVYNSYMAYDMMETSAAVSGGGAQVMAGEIEISASVSMVFQTK